MYRSLFQQQAPVLRGEKTVLRREHGVCHSGGLQLKSKEKGVGGFSFHTKLQWGIPNTRKNVRKHSPRDGRKWFSLLEQSNSGTTVSQHWGPPRLEVSSNTWESPEWQLWRFWCFSQRAHHQDSKNSEIGSRIALDGGHNVIKMASETLMGAKGFSCQGSHNDAEGLGNDKRENPWHWHQQQRLATILWQRGFKKQ